MTDAPTPFLATKLFIPPVTPGLVARPRLLQKLSGAFSTRLVLVSAPAGFGKTTVISEWIHSSRPPMPTAWLSLEDAENDPVRFWDYFTAALRTIHPSVGETFLSLQHSSEPVPVESALTTMINDLSAVLRDFVLVLDDYHFIGSPPVHRGVNFLLEHMPPAMHLVIATRADPPLALPHLRGRGLMLEIGADDPRFTLEEATGLLGRRYWQASKPNCGRRYQFQSCSRPTNRTQVARARTGNKSFARGAYCREMESVTACPIFHRFGLQAW